MSTAPTHEEIEARRHFADVAYLVYRDWPEAVVEVHQHSDGQRIVRVSVDEKLEARRAAARVAVAHLR